MKPNVFKSIINSIAAFIVFFLLFTLSILAIQLVFLLLSKIPIVNTILAWLFKVRGDTPSLFSLFLSAVISYTATTTLMEKINKDEATEGLSIILSGSYILIIQSISLIINLVSKNSFLINIVLIVSSIFLIVRGKDKL